VAFLLQAGYTDIPLTALAFRQIIQIQQNIFVCLLIAYAILYHYSSHGFLL
jgi:hypothetical protein